MSIAGLPGRSFVSRAAALGAVAVATAGLVPAPCRGATVLETPIRGSWTRLPLGRWAERISALTGVPVVVDRRLDFTLPITLESAGLPLAEVLDRVAALAAADVEVLASSLWLVPRAARGRAAAAERARDAALAALPAADRSRLAARAESAWPAGSQPRRLVAELATAAKLELAGLDDIPHDHLPATRLPPLTVAERIDLVLAQYDLRADWRPAGSRVMPLPAAPLGGTGPPSAVPRPRPRPRDEPAAERFSLRLEAPLEQAVAALARRFDLQPTIDAASLEARGISPTEIVRVHVEEVDRSGLLDAVVAPLGLSWTIEAGSLRVFAPPANPE